MPRHHVVSCVIFMIMGIVSSFVTPSSFRPRMLKYRMSIGSVSEATTSIKDSKGNDLKTGSVVIVTAEGLKAHQVSTKGHGTFVDGKFVPTIDDDGLPKGRRYFELPVGICGVVTKVYDVDDISANFPIQVKFQPGKHNEETGFDPPVAFLMHFSISEVELVSS